MTNLDEQAKTIFLHALERNPADVAEYLLQACGESEKLRREVELLLEGHRRGADLADRALAACGQTIPTNTLEDALTVGSRIGPYQIREQIGEGGMGVVYVAEQTAPVHRKVALKIIKPGMDTKEVIARFEAERQALAFMEHPNIARVLDAGATESRRSYFVMELVRGIPITEYCDRVKATPQERLELFKTVCDAVQHAHQKGIIHRDIKPSNVLVTQINAKPVVKVIDFGLAKATSGQNLTDRTVYTGFMRLMGTPAYMSPEQAGLSGLDVDTRSDIYSLGILLYELLTGTTPLDKTAIQKQAYDELCRQIREVEAPKPSARISTLQDGERSTIAEQRQIEPDRLHQLLHGDLDRVVLKTIEKDRDQRYETAKDLASDIERFLSDKPVHAVPPTQLYLARKYFRRNKVAILTAATVFAMSILATGVSSWLAIRATRAEKTATLAEREQSRLRQEAERSAATAQAMELTARQMAYSSDMNLAKRMIDENRLGRAFQLLVRSKPRPGQSDVRGWEWRYLWQACKADRHFDLCDREHSIYSLSASYDQKWAAVGEWESGGVSVWDLKTGTAIKSWASTEPRSLVAFSPVEAILAFSTTTTTANGKKTYVDLWDFDSQRRVARLPLQGQCKGLKFADDGGSLATASANPDWQGQICIWRVADGKQVSAWPVSIRAYPEAVPFAATNDLSLAAYANRKSIHIIDLATGEVFWKKRATEKGTVIALQFSPSGEVLASSSGFNDSSILLWESRSGKQIQRLQGHSGWVGDLVFWPDGETLASCSTDQTIGIWDLSDLENVPPPRRLGGHRLEVWRLALLPDVRTLLSGGEDGVAKIWDSSIARTRNEHVELPIRSAAFGIAADSRSIISVSWQGVVTDILGPEFQRTLPRMHLAKPLPRNGAVFWLSANDERIAVRTEDGSVEIYDLRLGERIPGINISAGRLVGFADQGSRLLVTHPTENTVEEWSLSSGQRLRAWQRPRSTSSALMGDTFVVSSDHQFLALARSGGELLLCNLLTGNERTENLNLKQILGLAISRDNKILAVATALGVTKLFDMPKLDEIVEFSGGALDMSFSPDGTRLTVGKLKLWDVGGQQELLRLGRDSLDSPTAQCEFSPDGSFVVARTWWGTLNIWRAPPWSEIERRGDP